MASLRIFLALDLPPALADAANQWTQALAAHLGPARARAVRWVAAHQRHATLHFLGAIEAGRVAPLANRLAAGVPLAPFTVELGQAGCFPERGHPRVVWLGLSAADHALEALRATLAVPLQALAIAIDERPFHPHVTIARVRPDAERAVARALRDWCGSERPHDAAARVGHVTCYESVPSPNGALYRTVVRAALLAR